MRIKEIKVYQFNELSDKAKQRAMDWYRDASYGDQWWEGIYEDAENVGIKITSFDCDRGNYIKGDFISGAEETAHKIEKDHGEICDTYKTAKAYLAERDTIIASAPKDENGDFENERELDGKLDDCDKEFLRSILEDYLSILRKEVEDYYSDERVTENILANEYEFDENGKRA
jgi:hypothetical protein